VKRQGNKTVDVDVGWLNGENCSLIRSLRLREASSLHLNSTHASEQDKLNVAVYSFAADFIAVL